MIETHEYPDQCEVIIDPSKVQLPQKLSLTLLDDGSIYLGDQMIIPPCDNGEKRFGQIKGAFETGRYKLVISSRGQMKLEI